MKAHKFYKLLKNILKNNDFDKKELPTTYKVIDDLMDWQCEDFDDQIYFIYRIINSDRHVSPKPDCVVSAVLKWFKWEIDNEEPQLACDLGALYYRGKFIKQDYRKAVKYYKFAAKHGCRQAIENLGYCYYYGRDGEFNYEKAFNYFLKGALEGNIRSLYKIGDMFKNGYFVKKDKKEAYLIYRHCFDLFGENSDDVAPDVMMRLGDCYFKGMGTEVNYEEALQVYQRAEQIFYKRLQEGDFWIRGCYEHVIEMQGATRKKLKKALDN